MCGRYTDHLTWREIVELYRILDPYLTPRSNFQPRYNLAPTQTGLVVRLDAAGQREPVGMRWGLVPGWAKDIKIGATMINAKAETVATKPAFRSAFKARPCLVVATGFYEWKALGGKRKQPYYIRLKEGAPFAFGGLWERWRDPAAADQPPMESYTILTTAPNVLMAGLHDRMPLILAPEQWQKWLGAPEERAALLDPFPADRMECWPVSDAVGNVRNDDTTLLEPVAAATA